MSCIFFFFSCSGDHRDLHSFPTRRSSDLALTVYYPSHRFGVLGGAVYLVDYGDLDRTDSASNTIARIAPRNIEFLRSEEHTSELQSPDHLVCRLLLEKKNKKTILHITHNL